MLLLLITIDVCYVADVQGQICLFYSKMKKYMDLKLINLNKKKLLLKRCPVAKQTPLLHDRIKRLMSAAFMFNRKASTRSGLKLNIRLLTNCENE